MTQSLASLFALLLGAAILLLGNGLQNILIPIRAGLDGFLITQIGLVASAYSVGFVASCLLAPRVVASAGHIRSFAAFAALAAASILAMALLVHPLAWALLRAVGGFCFAGLFMVIESWLAERSTNSNRGQIFAIYMIINLVAVTGGQLLLTSGDPSGYPLFILAAVAITLALVPVSLSTSVAPAAITQVRLRLGYLYRISPVGMVGCLCVGLGNGAFSGLGPLYAQQLGLSTNLVVVFMSAVLAGGALSQLPLGRLSDRLDRRTVMIAASTSAVVACITLANLAGMQLTHWNTDLSTRELLLTAVILGSCIYPLYALCSAHTNDFVQPSEFIEASSGLLLCYGIGAILGPVAGAIAMEWLGAGGLFVFMGISYGGFASFTLYRKTRRAPIPVDERSQFVQASTARLPTPPELDPRCHESLPVISSEPTAIIVDPDAAPQ